MDARHLDSLVRLFASAESRRRVLALLAAMPLLGNLPGGPEPDAAAARKRHAPATAQRKRGRKHKKKHKKKPCQPQTTAQTCAGRCGNVTNNCNQPVACPPTCANPTPVCANTTCVACERNTQCASGQICDEGRCAACDVCPGGACTFTSIQAAINATSPQLSTIHVCPGTYVENAGPTSAVAIARALRLVGAGSGENDASSTIVMPAQSNAAVVFVGSASPVALQGLRLTGGNGLNGRGAQIFDSRVELKQCTIAHNVAGVPGGGFSMVGPGTQVTLTDTLVIANTGDAAGGVEVQGAGSTLTLDALSRITGNTATGGWGGVRAADGVSVSLPNVNNVTNNTSSGALKNCSSTGTFTGPGAVCTTT